MDNLINRQAVIDTLCDNCDHVEAVCPHYPCKQYIAIENLPPAQPERKMGKWNIWAEDRTEWYHVTCSECVEDVTATIPLIGMFPNYKALWNFCPYCGTKMEVEDGRLN